MTPALTLHIAFWIGKKISGRKWETGRSIFCRPSSCCFFLSALLLAAFTPLPAAEFFVSPAGDDTNPGTAAKPFATLERAHDAARQQGERGRIVLRGGVYYLKQTLTLEPQDSGLTIAAAKGEEVVISGGRVVNEWRPWRGEVLQSDLGCAPNFKMLNCVVIMAPANGPSVYYLDNVEFKPEKTR